MRTLRVKWEGNRNVTFAENINSENESTARMQPINNNQQCNSTLVVIEESIKIDSITPSQQCNEQDEIGCVPTTSPQTPDKLFENSNNSSLLPKKDDGLVGNITRASQQRPVSNILDAIEPDTLQPFCNNQHQQDDADEEANKNATQKQQNQTINRKYCF
jgi:hypothetical protein